MHIGLYISGHGLGHLAQSGPVANALGRLDPSIRLTVSTPLPETVVRRRITAAFRYRHWLGDPGFVMADAITADAERSLAAFREFHHNWEERIDAEASWQRDARLDCVVSNVAHLPLAAAADTSAGLALPSIALCSINWADMYKSFFGEDEIYHEIRQSYAAARYFIQPEPSMPMLWIRQRIAVPPIAAENNGSCSDSLRQQLCDELNLPAGTRPGLITTGGFSLHLDPRSWAKDEFFWIISGTYEPTACSIGTEQLGMDFMDLVKAADVVVIKPGYGLITECTVAGKPLLFVPRNDWPEQDALLTWRRSFGRIREVRQSDIAQGRLTKHALAVLNEPAFAPPEATGAEASARLVLETARAEQHQTS